jgi:hypothetical protein
MEDENKITGLEENSTTDQLPAAVMGILAEDIRGIEEEIVGLRRLGRLLLERQGQAEDSREVARLGDAYTRTAFRLAGLIKAEQELAKRGKSSEWAEAVLQVMDRHEIEEGRQPVSAGVRAEALGRQEDLSASSRRLAEEVAAVRHILRQTLKLAMEAKEDREIMRLTDSYGQGCLRLLKLLRMEEVDSGKLERFLKELIDGAIEENARLMGLE